jgi:hypothetical protein
MTINSRTVPRFDLRVVERTPAHGEPYTDASMKESPRGKYVSYEDYEELYNQKFSETVPRWKFNALVAQCKKMEEVEFALRSQVRNFRCFTEQEVWYWDNQEENHIESLSCPVVISADDLRQLLQQAALKGG